MTRTTARLAGALVAGSLLLAGCGDATTGAHGSSTTKSHGDTSASASEIGRAS